MTERAGGLGAVSATGSAFGNRSSGREKPADRPDSMLDPEAIARTCVDNLRQDRRAWSWEIEVRPWTEAF